MRRERAFGLLLAESPAIATFQLPVTSALLMQTPDPGSPDLAADLSSAGVNVLGACACNNLVQAAVREAPDVVVCWEPAPGEAFFRALRLLRETQARPVVVFTDDLQAETMERALGEGVAGWVVQGYSRERLRPLLQLACTRFRLEHEQRQALADLSERHEERKLVDRAKGLLMQAGEMPEEEAFGLLRSASMQAKLRVGQVARQVIVAARDADAVNRAGQLRMLSQRLVKLYALAAAGPETQAARALMAASQQRVERLLGQLRRTLSLPTFGDLLSSTEQAFERLKGALSRDPSADAMAEADGLAEELLACAERLTGALQTSGPRATLRVINLSGRQRMLSQRLAKQALLGTVDAARPAQVGLDGTIEEFESALSALKQAPLSTPDIRAALYSVDNEWHRMLQHVHDAASPAGRMVVAQASEALLSLFEQLTERYEKSLEVLMR